MSLADELLADFEEDGDRLGDDEEEDQIGELADVDDVSMDTDIGRKSSVRNIAKLRDSLEVHKRISKKVLIGTYLDIFLSNLISC